MAGYTKLFGSIIHSTIWREPDHVRLVWVTMLALADKDGSVEASVPGLADVARVSLDQCLDALDRFQKPDRFSRNKAAEGRRIEEIPGGWQLLNHSHYRRLMSEEERRARDAERKRNQRASKARPQASENVREVSHSEAEAEAAPDADAKSKAECAEAGGARTLDVPKCDPHPQYIEQARMAGVSRECAAEVWDYWREKGLPQGGVRDLYGWLIGRAKKRGNGFTPRSPKGPRVWDE